MCPLQGGCERSLEESRGGRVHVQHRDDLGDRATPLSGTQLGVVWADSWTDTYNAISRQAVIAWRQGFDSKAEQEVEAMYRMAAQFDQLGKELAEKD